jgi:peptidoglycan/xylan/chitin deacetylase (PgdA/CDA1 family)
VIFIVTGRMDDPSPLWWDICAETFRQTEKTHADLPLIGEQVFETAEAKAEIGHQFIEVLKAIPEDEKQVQVETLQRILDVTLPNTRLFFGWEQVRELADNGIACQPHTVTHPILTRIPEAEMVRQVTESRQHVIDRSGQDAIAFAYPNGFTADYNQATIQALQDNGYAMAFTLIPGPMPASEIRKYPFQIKRIFLSYHDTLEVFQMKVMGIPALRDGGNYL